MLYRSEKLCHNTAPFGPTFFLYRRPTDHSPCPRRYQQSTNCDAKSKGPVRVVNNCFTVFRVFFRFCRRYLRVIVRFSPGFFRHELSPPPFPHRNPREDTNAKARYTLRTRVLRGDSCDAYLALVADASL